MQELVSWETDTRAGGPAALMCALRQEVLSSDKQEPTPEVVLSTLTLTDMCKHRDQERKEGKTEHSSCSPHPCPNPPTHPHPAQQKLVPKAVQVGGRKEEGKKRGTDSHSKGEFECL